MSDSTRVDIDLVPAVSPAPAVFVPLPDGLDQMAPGPELGAVLARVDRAGCNGFQLAELLRARHRQLCWLQAELLSDTYALVHAHGGGPLDPPARSMQRDEHAEEQVAFALSVTMHAAEKQTGLAWASLVRAPAVHEALREGRIDLPKAKVLLDEVELLDEDQARALVDRVLPEARDDTIGKLRNRLRRLVLAVYPDAVRRRHRKAREGRDVRCIQHRDGTASIIGSGLPADKAEAAMDHISRIATSTHEASESDGRTGDRDIRRMSQIKADVFVNLLDAANPTISAEPGAAGAMRAAARTGVVNVSIDLSTLMRMTKPPGRVGRVRAGRARHRRPGRRGTQRRSAAAVQQHARRTATNRGTPVPPAGRRSESPGVDAD